MPSFELGGNIVSFPKKIGKFSSSMMIAIFSEKHRKKNSFDFNLLT